MTAEIYLGEEFKRQFKRLAKKYRSLPADFKVLLQSLEADPMQGADLGNGMHKVRMAIASKGKGKSGGARVIAYHVFATHDHLEITLLTIYDKGELANVSDSYLKSLLAGLL
ncbi:type II toxin-antitoxin system RelE/ParE family toxin [Hallella seregens ATCC 51272]|uniref:Type II toxin-antitoxin system RelE/ParE family toxin n=1 Tax=Hallella seregens ATCC 51272 TaxID=1336250 RepID=A0ABV5ZIV2_9BACT